MPFLKVQKTKSYASRFQVKYRRRREGKTDYKQRRALVIQDKNKYQAPKHRLVVRITNSTVIVQIVKSPFPGEGESMGDKVIASAYSSELKDYGVKCGFKNYTAAYLTGYLCARRLLKTLDMDTLYPGVEEPDGVIHTTHAKHPHTGKDLKRKVHYVKEMDDEKRPFRAFLDVGIHRTTTGARIFGAMKGAVDGGLDVPHNEKRFPGYIKEAKKYDADALRDRITGAHIKEYMEYLEEEDVETYEKRFAGWIEKEITGDEVESMYSAAMTAIKENPVRKPAAPYTPDKSFKKPGKSTVEERRKRVAEKKAAQKEKLLKAMADAGGDEEEEEEEEDDE